MTELFTGQSIYDFQDQFGTDELCIDALVALKWEHGYSCRRCGYKKYCRTGRYGARRCCSCGRVESATSNTLFHKLKFPLHKAFFLLYLISTTKRGISAEDLHRKLGLNKRTCLLFKRKAMEAMASQSIYKMTGQVEIDETFVGGKDQGSVGRSKSSKKLVVVGIERNNKGILKAYARQIDNAGVKQLKPFFEDHICKQAKIKTDKWRSYTSLKKDYKKLNQVKSKGGKNFNMLHRFIMGLKSWLRGIHSSVRDLQAYLDEYVFRFNRHLSKGNIFNIILKRMVNFEPRTYNQIFNVT